jgi:putative SOS response-associated peptidase YedK
MCGRYVLRSSLAEVTQTFALDSMPDLPLVPRFNITPQSQVLAVRMGEAGRECLPLNWGLVPFWSKSPRSSTPLINARAETVAEKPSFREAFRRRRCLIPANGWYEWRQSPGGEKQPFLLQVEDAPLFAFAGIWDRWVGKGEVAGQILESCAILTTGASAAVSVVHDRMPVIIPPALQAGWLEEGGNVLLSTFEPPSITLHPVSRRVNSPRNDDESLLLETGV